MTNAERIERIEEIEALPGRLRTLITGATDAQLGRAYKPGGWNARQVVHHLADSHMNSFIRCRLIVTEDNPTLKPYDQDAWAVLQDSHSGPLEASLAILEGLHRRWGLFFRSLQDEAWQRQGFHPENGPMTLEQILDGYARHGRNHLEHIRIGIEGA